MTWFKARNMPTVLRRKRSGADFPNPGWSRLQRHIARHKKAGGMTCINVRRLEKPVEVEGFDCVEMADIELFEPLT